MAPEVSFIDESYSQGVALFGVAVAVVGEPVVIALVDVGDGAPIELLAVTAVDVVAWLSLLRRSSTIWGSINGFNV